MDVPSLRPRPPAIDKSWALFLDVDGTLLELAATPDDVRVSPALRGRLRALFESMCGAVALVSGRSIATLDALFELPELPVVGLHGLERRTQSGVLQAPTTPVSLAKIEHEARMLAHRYPGAVVEAKGGNLALHWRLAASAETAFRDFAIAAIKQLPGYTVQAGHCVLELRPSGADKGDSIVALMEAPPFLGRKPVFVGDDLTDESGFAAVNERNGITVLVGARKNSAAHFSLDHPRAVLNWLGVSDTKEQSE